MPADRGKVDAIFLGARKLIEHLPIRIQAVVENRTSLNLFPPGPYFGIKNCKISEQGYQKKPCWVVLKFQTMHCLTKNASKVFLLSA